MGWKNTADKKELILNAAETCLRRRQLSQLNIRDVAKEAGISLGSVHYYFSSKEHILMEIFRRFVSRVSRATLERASDSDPGQVIFDFIDGYFSEISNDPGACHIFIDLWGNVCKYKELKLLLDKYYRKSLEWLTSLLDEGKQQGIFNVKDPANTASLIITIIDGFKVQIHLFESEINLKKMNSACKEFVTQALNLKNG